MVEHCRDARYVWNMAVEQANLYRRHLGPTPNHLQRCRQLTEARHEFDWLAAGSQTVQQQALRDFDQGMTNWWAGTHRRPSWRKAGLNEGFRQVALKPDHVQRLNRRWAQVLVPKVGWVRFRWTRAVPADVKSYRVTMDRAGRWHIAFAVKPEPIEGPGDGSIVGIDRGVANTLTLSTGEMMQSPAPIDARRAARHLSRATRGSKRRQAARLGVAKLKARDADRRKDWAEKSSTAIAMRFGLVRIEDLRIANMVRSAKGTIGSPGTNVRQKAGLNRSILAQGGGLFARRLGDKIGDRLELVLAAYTSQRCSTCGEVDPNSRESQAKFVCTTCGFVEHADVNAARNIAAGHAATARRGLGVVDLPVKREPQLVASG